MKSVVYIYDRYLTDGFYNPNNMNRYNQYNTVTILAKEIQSKFPGKQFLTYCGYQNNPMLTGIEFTELLTAEELNLLDIVYSNHVNNVPDKFIIVLDNGEGDFIHDPANPEQAYLFDTEEAANQFIINDGLTNAIVRGIVVLY